MFLCYRWLNTLFSLCFLLPGIVSAAIPDEEIVEQVVEAIRYTEFGRVKTLTAEMDKEAINVETYGGNTFLHEAVETCLSTSMFIRAGERKTNVEKLKANSCKIYEYLLSSGADPTARNDQGYTPVMVALQNLIGRPQQDYTIARKLIEYGGDANSVDYHGNNILNFYVAKYALYQRLRKRAYEQIKSSGDSKQAARMSRIVDLQMQEPETVIRNLMKLGVDINAVNESKLSPLLSSARSGAHREVIEALISNGADPTFIDGKGRTAIHLLITSSTRRLQLDTEQVSELDKIISLLVDSGISINATDGRRHTPLAYVIKLALDLEKAIERAEKHSQKQRQMEKQNDRSKKNTAKLESQLKAYQQRIDTTWNLARAFIKKGANTDVYIPGTNDKTVTVFMDERPELQLGKSLAFSVLDRIRNWFAQDEEKTGNE